MEYTKKHYFASSQYRKPKGFSFDNVSGCEDREAFVLIKRGASVFDKHRYCYNNDFHSQWRLSKIYSIIKLVVLCVYWENIVVEIENQLNSAHYLFHSVKERHKKSFSYRNIFKLILVSVLNHISIMLTIRSTLYFS